MRFLRIQNHLRSHSSLTRSCHSTDNHHPLRPGEKGRRPPSIHGALCSSRGEAVQQAVQEEERRRQGGHARRRQGPILLRAVRAARQGAARAVLHHAPVRHDARVLARVRLSPDGGRGRGAACRMQASKLREEEQQQPSKGKMLDPSPRLIRNQESCVKRRFFPLALCSCSLVLSALHLYAPFGAEAQSYAG